MATNTRNSRNERRPARREREEEVRIRPIRERLTKTAMFDMIAELAETDRRSVKSVMDALVTVVQGSLHERGAREITIPGVVRLLSETSKPKKVPAEAGGEEKLNSFTGEMVITKARPAFVKPAMIKVRARPVAALKKAAGYVPFSPPEGKEVKLRKSRDEDEAPVRGRGREREEAPARGRGREERPARREREEAPVRGRGREEARPARREREEAPVRKRTSEHRSAPRSVRGR